jgi:hypothetical protein
MVLSKIFGSKREVTGTWTKLYKELCDLLTHLQRLCTVLTEM